MEVNLFNVSPEDDPTVFPIPKSLRRPFQEGSSLYTSCEVGDVRVISGKTSPQSAIPGVRYGSRWASGRTLASLLLVYGTVRSVPYY